MKRKCDYYEKFFKVISLLTLFWGFFYLTQGTVSADGFENSIQVQAPLTMEVGESVSQTVVDDEFGQGVITITKIDDGEEDVIRPAWEQVAAQKASNSTYHINYVRGVINCGFYITINTRNITRAYDLWYRNLVGTSSASLVLESNRQATAYFQFQASVPWINGPSWNGALRARLDADYLVTMVN